VPEITSPDDFTAFYTKYRSYVAFCLIKYSYPGETDDGVQDTMLKFWRNKAHYQPSHDGWLPLLGTIAQRLSMDLRRKRETWNYSYDPDLDDRQDSDYDPVRYTLSQERNRLLGKMLTALSPRDRMALLSRHVSQVNPREIFTAKAQRMYWKQIIWRAAMRARDEICADPDTYGPLIPAITGEATDDAKRLAPVPDRSWRLRPRSARDLPPPVPRRPLGRDPRSGRFAPAPAAG
jgi:RNA polymerase sigma factor (sigma-70 family)